MSNHAVVGHEPLWEQFRQSIRRGRLAHAYLFVGPEGIGKKRFAIALAQGLLCEIRPPEALDPCGTCPACLQVHAGTHPDFFLVGLPPDKHELPIELFVGSRDRRNQEGLCYDLSLKPVRGRRKIAVIDDADLLNVESANCLLKTLEEPSPGALLILIGTAADLQLPTIRSRCQVVRFSPLEPGQVAALLLERGIVNDREQAEFLARRSGGSVGRAAALADRDLWQFRKVLLRQIADAGFDPVDLSRQVVDFVEAIDKKGARRRARARQVVGFCRDFFRDALVQACGMEPGTYGQSDQDAVDRWSGQVGSGKVGVETVELAAALVERCMEAERHIDRRVQLALAVEALFDDLSRLQERARRGSAAASPGGR